MKRKSKKEENVVFIVISLSETNEGYYSERDIHGVYKWKEEALKAAKLLTSEQDNEWEQSDNGMCWTCSPDLSHMAMTSVSVEKHKVITKKSKKSKDDDYAE